MNVGGPVGFCPGPIEAETVVIGMGPVTDTQVSSRIFTFLSSRVCVCLKIEYITYAASRRLADG